jgi:hypothetical protein
MQITDALYILKRGRVIRADYSLRWGEWRYVVEGKDVDGRDLQFPVTFSEQPKRIEIVTGWARKKESRGVTSVRPLNTCGRWSFELEGYGQGQRKPNLEAGNGHVRIILVRLAKA